MSFGIQFASILSSILRKLSLNSICNEFTHILRWSFRSINALGLATNSIATFDFI